MAETLTEAPDRPAGNTLFRLDGDTMGTRYAVAFAAPRIFDFEALGKDVFRAVDRVDRQMSTWKPESDLCAFNRTEPGEWVPVPDALAFVVSEGLRVGRESNFAFDMTVGTAVSLWGFGPEGAPDELPTNAALTDARAVTMADRLDVRRNPPALRKNTALQIDLSGIAKGFGVDRIVDVLEAAGITDYLASIDGELRLRGHNPETGERWTVAIEEPVAGKRQAWDILQPPACAIATSGDYRKFRSVGGRRYSHTIDARTARPVENSIGSVTVACDTCLMADAWATALLVLGPVDGVALARQRNIAALFLIRRNDRIEEISVGEFDRLIG